MKLVNHTVQEVGAAMFHQMTKRNRSPRRQQMPPCFQTNDLCFAVRHNTLLSHGHSIEENCAAALVDRLLVNINEAIDPEFAKFLMARAEPVT